MFYRKKLCFILKRPSYFRPFDQNSGILFNNYFIFEVYEFEIHESVLSKYYSCHRAFGFDINTDNKSFIKLEYCRCFSTTFDDNRHPFKRAEYQCLRFSYI